MAYRHSDSGGTDDDLPPSQAGAPLRGGHISINERSMSGSGHYRRSAAPDSHLRKLELDAYIGVVRAFKAQSAAITWRKEHLMVTLRQELRISDEEHLEIVMGMDSNNAPSQLRERDDYRGPMYVSHGDSFPGVTMPLSRKRQKSTYISQASPGPSMTKSALSPPSLALPNAGKGAPPVGGSRRQNSRGLAGTAVGARLPMLGESLGGEVMADPWADKRVGTRWPEDTTLSEAVMTDDTNKLPGGDLQYGAGPTSLSNKGPSRATANLAVASHVSANRGSKRGGERSGMQSPVGRGRSTSKGPADSLERPAQELPSRSKKDATPENGLEVKALKHIQFPSLDALVKQVDKIAEEDDLAKVESVRRAAKEHEEMLRKALAEIGDSSEEADTDEDEACHLRRPHSMEHERDGSREHSKDQHGAVEEDNAAGGDKEVTNADRLVADAV